MAIDTSQKRMSCIGRGLTFLRTGVVPDGSGLGAAQRLLVDGFYSGIPAGAPPAGIAFAALTVVADKLVTPLTLTLDKLVTPLTVTADKLVTSLTVVVDG